MKGRRPAKTSAARAVPAALTEERTCISKVMRLPLDLRDELDRKIAERQLTTKELLSFVRSKKPEADVSRSGVQRYAQRSRAQLERHREERLMGAAIAEALGKASHGEPGRLLSEMLRLIVFQDLRQAFQGGPWPQTAEVLKFATAIERVAAADKLAVEVAVKRQAVKREEESALKRQEEARQTTQSKLTEASAEEIRRLLLPGYPGASRGK